MSRAGAATTTTFIIISIPILLPYFPHYYKCIGKEPIPTERERVSERKFCCRIITSGQSYDCQVAEMMLLMIQLRK